MNLCYLLRMRFLHRRQTLFLVDAAEDVSKFPVWDPPEVRKRIFRPADTRRYYDWVGLALAGRAGSC